MRQRGQEPELGIHGYRHRAGRHAAAAKGGDLHLPLDTSREAIGLGKVARGARGTFLDARDFRELPLGLRATRSILL